MKAEPIHVIGCHAEGEVGDVIVAGVPPPPGASVFEMRQAFARDSDHIRRRLLCEPRGSVARHINLLVPPTVPGCDAGVIIMEPTEYPPMSGSNTLCVVTVLLETGRVPMVEPVTVVRLEMPGGVVEATAECRDGKCVSVTLQNVPCFVARLDAPIILEDGRELTVDIAYGGMFYAIADVSRLGFQVVPDEARALAELGESIRHAARAQHPDIVHPGNPDIAGVSIVQLNTPFEGAGGSSRNACIVAPGRCDRSPTGTGLSARLAVLHARGLLKIGDAYAHTSIIGSRFEGRIVGETEVGGRPAIVPTIKGRAWITGEMRYTLDPSDPFPDGYVVADTWGVTPGVKQ
jgi:proline racemase